MKYGLSQLMKKIGNPLIAGECLLEIRNRSRCLLWIDRASLPLLIDANQLFHTGATEEPVKPGCCSDINSRKTILVRINKVPR